MQNLNILNTLLRILINEIPDTAGVRLINKDGGTVTETGVCNPPYTRFEFSSQYQILLSKAPELCGVQEKAAVRTVKDLYYLFESLSRKSLSGNIPVHAYKSGEIYPALFQSLYTHMQSTARNDHLESILSISSEILQAKDLRTALNVLVAMAREAVQAGDASVLLTDPRTDEICFFVVDGEDAEKLKEIRIPSGRGIAGSVIASGKGEIIQDVALDPRFYMNVDRSTGKITRDMIASPVFSDERVAGVIEVINSQRKGGFTREDLEFLNAISRHMGLLLENARNQEYLLRSRDGLDQKNNEINLFYKLAEILSSESGTRRTDFFRHLLSSTGYRRAELLAPEDGSGSVASLRSVAARDASQPADQPDSIPATVWKETSDIVIWLKNQNEPFYFRPGPGDPETAGGFLKRFYEANPSGDIPDAWILLSDAPLQILSLTEPAGKPTLPSGTSFYAALRRLGESLEPMFIPEESEDTPEPKSMKIFRGSVLVIRVFNLEEMENNVSPGGLRKSLDEFHAVLIKEIKRFGGQAQVTMGDHLTAAFPQKNRKGALNAGQALDCCLAIRENFRSAQSAERKDGIITPALQFGIHAGVAYQYRNSESADFGLAGTLIATAHNLARLNSYYKTDVLLSESAAAVLMNERADIRETDLVQFSGSTRPLRIYGIQPSHLPVSARYKDQWQMAVKEYQKGSFKRALILFEGIPDQEHDSVLQRYIKRCSEYAENPPGQFSSVFEPFF